MNNIDLVYFPTRAIIRYEMKKEKRKKKIIKVFNHMAPKKKRNISLFRVAAVDPGIAYFTLVFIIPTL